MWRKRRGSSKLSEGTNARVTGIWFTCFIQNEVFVRSSRTSGTMIEIEYEMNGAAVTVKMAESKNEIFFYDPYLKCDYCDMKNKGGIIAFKEYKSKNLSVCDFVYCKYCNTLFGGTIIWK